VPHPVAGAVGLDQPLEQRDRLGHQPRPLVADAAAGLADRLVAQRVGEDRLVEVAAAVGEHVRDRGRQVVADVVAEEAEPRGDVAARLEGLAGEPHGVRRLVERGQVEPAQLVEQRARMHVPGDRAGERLEARRLADPRQRDRRAVGARERRIGAPACEDLHDRRDTGGLGRARPAHEPRHLPAVQAGGGAHVADAAVLGQPGSRLERDVHERGLDQLLDRRPGCAAGHHQPRERAQHAADGVLQQVLGVRAVGCVHGTASRDTVIGHRMCKLRI
jgi:hypothetical protein